MIHNERIKLSGFGPDETVKNLITDRPLAGSSIIIGGNCYWVDYTKMPSGPYYKLCNDEGATVAMAASRLGMVYQILKLADRDNEIL